MNVSRMVLNVLVVWAAASGCTTDRAGRPFETADGQELPILREVSGTYSSIGRSLRLVVHDAGTLATLPIDVGPVDFDREMVLVSAMGPTPSPDYAIRIRRVWRDGSVLRASVDVSYPPPEAQMRSTSASPYHAVIVPRSSLNVRNFGAGAVPGTLAGRATAAGS